MSERWTQMLETLRQQFPTDSDIGELETFLAANGLNRQEIGEVLSLYFADVASIEIPNEAELTSAPFRTASMRVQGPHERGRFSVEAWGYLIMLHESGVVTAFDFEQLVERALFHVDGRIGLPEIRALADEVGLDATSLGTDRSLLH